MSEEKVRELEELLDKVTEGFWKPGIEVEVRFICGACDGRFATLTECSAGLDYVPPDPMPLGARMWDTILGRSGVVAENKVVSLSEGHQHERRITFGPDDKSGYSWVCIREGYDSGSGRFVLESEWETQQQSRKGGTQEG